MIVVRSVFCLYVKDIIIVTMYWNNSQDVEKIKEVLTQDKIVLGSGDTVLGLLGQLTEKSYDSLNHIKQRSGKPYLILIGSISKLPLFVDQRMTPQLEKLITLGWPGPLTLIFKAHNDLPVGIKSSDGTIAIRIPDHVGLLELLTSFDGLFSTSANIHSQPIPQLIAEVDQNILNQVGGICLDVVEANTESLPSTILDCSSGEIKVVRIGCGLSDKLKKIII